MTRWVQTFTATLAAWMFGWLAFAQTAPDTRVVEAAVARDAYWRALDAGEYAAAYDLFTPGMQALNSRDVFSVDSVRLAQQMGLVIERRVMRTTVYDNPPSAPEPGVYVAFDFVGRFANADRHCGYIILHQSAQGGPFLVTRTDQTFLGNDQAGSNQDTDEVWAQMATSFCPGWQRSWAIQPPV